MTGASTFSAWRFPDDIGAQRAVHRLAWTNGDFLQISDAAVVSWPEDRERPLAWQALELEGGCAFAGAFWGMLIGLLFLLPLCDVGVGRDGESRFARSDTTVGGLVGLGFDQAIIASIRAEVVPGTSALLVFDRSDSPWSLGTSMPAKAERVASKMLTATQMERLHAGFDC